MKALLDYISKHKVYVLLFVAVVLAYCILLWISHSISLRDKEPSQELAAFQELEKQWQEKVSNKEMLQQYQKEHPTLWNLFQAFSLFVIAAFSLGLLIDFMLLFNPVWRRNLGRRAPPEVMNWPTDMLFKFVTLWLTLSLVLNLLMNFLHVVVFPKLTLNFYALFHTTILDLMTILIIFYLVFQQQGGRRDLGLNFSEIRPLREIGIGVAGYMAIFPAFVLTLMFLIFFIQIFKMEPPPHPLVGVFLEEEKKSPWLVVYSIILATVIGPICEEIFFRGFCYPILKQKLGTLWGMVISSGFFAVIHYNLFAFWPIFVLGMGLVFLYEKRKNLIAPIVLHILHNTVFIGYFFLAKEILTS